LKEKEHFQVWRQDDNGHQFLIQSFASREEAQALIAKLSAGFHKQTYWIKETQESISTERDCKT